MKVLSYLFYDPNKYSTAVDHKERPRIHLKASYYKHNPLWGASGAYNDVRATRLRDIRVLPYHHHEHNRSTSAMDHKERHFFHIKIPFKVR